jgi:hypothetical protein
MITRAGGLPLTTVEPHGLARFLADWDRLPQLEGSDPDPARGAGTDARVRVHR